MTPATTAPLSGRKSAPGEIPASPQPLILTVASTEAHFACSLCAPLEYAHRYSQPFTEEQNNALVQAVVRGLTSITPIRLTAYQKARRAHEEAVEIANAFAEGREAVETEHSQVPISIRTGSRELIEAGTYLRALRKDVEEANLNSLQYQLKRFDVSWQELPSDSEEVAALQRWATLNCVPGRAAFRDGPSCDAPILSHCLDDALAA